MKTLLIIVVIVALLVVITIGIHALNVRRYAITGQNPQDKSAYETGEHIQAIEGQYLNGFHFLPPQKQHAGAVILFGGSEGSPDYTRAQQLYHAGYEVFALFFFGQYNQQKALVDVPLEFFNELKDLLPTGSVTVVGSSKGAELAANLASHGAMIDHIVLFAPSEFTYQGLSSSGQESSSFTKEGEPLPYLRFRDSSPSAAAKMFLDMAFGLPVSYRPVYEPLPQRAANVAQARIKIENYAGDGLLFAGEEDAMWPGNIAARNPAQRNTRLEAHIFPNAGHLFLGDITALGRGWKRMFGGTVEGNRAAKVESDRILFAKLAQWHRQPDSSLS